MDYPKHPIAFAKFLAGLMQKLHPDLGVEIGWDEFNHILLFGLSQQEAKTDDSIREIMGDALTVLVERQNDYHIGYADPNDPWLRIENPVAYFPPLRNAA